MNRPPVQRLNTGVDVDLVRQALDGRSVVEPLDRRDAFAVQEGDLDGVGVAAVGDQVPGRRRIVGIVAVFQPRIDDHLLRLQLPRMDLSRGYVLVDMPKNSGQADVLDSVLNDLGRPVDLVLNLEVDRDDLMERLVGAIECDSCGASYNMYVNPPMVDNVCDYCGARVRRRPDDYEETISNRLRDYDMQMGPLLQYYNMDEKLQRVDAGEGGEPLWSKVRAVIEATPSPEVTPAIAGEPPEAPPAEAGRKPSTKKAKVKKATAGKAAAGKKAANKAAGKKAAAKKAATKKAPAKKAASKKTTPKQKTVKKVAAKKAASKKAAASNMDAAAVSGVGGNGAPASRGRRPSGLNNPMARWGRRVSATDRRRTGTEFRRDL